MAKQEESQGCKHTQCAISWLKIVDDWTIGGWKNTFPRLYYVVAGIVVLFILI